jgi:hypothetical protein
VVVSQSLPFIEPGQQFLKEVHSAVATMTAGLKIDEDERIDSANSVSCSREEDQ